MGLIGSFVAWAFHREGIPFTWSDNDSPYTSWKASTGCVYPSGDPDQERDHKIWKQWHEGDAPWGRLRQYTEAAAFWYNTVNPPHHGHYRPSLRLGNLKLASQQSYHINPQTLVPDTRDFFAKQRVSEPRYNQKVIVTHSYDPRRLGYYLWGWTALVELWLDPELRKASQPMRPCFYFHRGIYFTYCYPVGNTGLWYAGTSIIRQNDTRSRPIEPKFEVWKRNFEEMSENRVRVMPPVKYIEGWRPAPKDAKEPIFAELDGQWVLRPHWHNGIRCAPSVVKAALEIAKEVTVDA